MAQDFYTAFKLGDDSKYISTVDVDGVALEAIQGLYQIVQKENTQISKQKQQIASLEARLQVLEETSK